MFYNYSYLTFFHWVICQVYFVRFVANLEQDEDERYKSLSIYVDDNKFASAAFRDAFKATPKNGSQTVKKNGWLRSIMSSQRTPLKKH